MSKKTLIGNHSRGILAKSLKLIESNTQTDIMSKISDSHTHEPISYKHKLDRQSHTIMIEKYVIPLKHKKCGYQWEYGGKNPYYATCPYCRNQVNIKKNAIRSEPSLEAGLTPLSGAKGVIISNG